MQPRTGPDAYAIFGRAVWRSDDGAATWRRVGSLGSDPTVLKFLLDGRPVVGFVVGGLAVSGDRGATWSPFGTGLPASRVNEIHHRSASVVLVATESGLYRSADAGQTFTKVTTGLVDANAPALGISGDGTLGTYLAMPGHGINTTYLYYSSDEGTVWQLRTPIYSQNLLARVNPGALEMVVQSSLSYVYAGTPFGLFRTTLGTSTSALWAWERVEPEPGGTAIGELAFEDKDPGPLRQHVVYATVKRASPAAVDNTGARLTAPGWYDELEGGRICGGLVARADGMLVAACGRHIFRSTDGGATWAGAGNGLPYLTVGVGDTPYNPLVASADGSVWTSGFHYGLYRSNAQVTSWSKVPFPGASVGAIGTHPSDASTVYAAGMLTNGSTGLLYKSTDGGTTWGRPIADLGTSIYTIDVHATAPETVLVAAFSRGIWRSTDGGASFVQAPGISGSVYGARFTSADPDRAWAVTSEGLFRSDDRGATWELVGRPAINGNPFTAFRLAPSPWDADTIYLPGTVGDMLVSRDGGETWSRTESGLPKPSCGVCDEVGTPAFDKVTPGILWVTAGVLGSGADPQSSWVYRAVDPEVG